jgi:thiol-disulfide isomerase/thioredoxin
VVPCDQWAGPFGHETDQTIDPNQSWEGFAPGSSEVATVGLDDFALCGGDEETRAIVVYIDALWCSVCRLVASDLAAKYESEWKARGVQLVTLVVEDADGAPATLESAWEWRNTYGLEDTSVLADGAYVLANDYPRTLPQALIIDPKTMRVVARPIGRVDLDPLLEALLADE